MTSGTAISRSVLSDQVKDRLLRAILDGRFPPGSRIVETRAAREFGTSQAPVREALRDLEAVGVVEITPFHGARVRHPTTNELLEAFVVRSELESLGIRLAVPHVSEADLDALQADLDQMRRAATLDDLHAEAAADARFHGRLMKMAANSTLEQVWRRLEPFSRTYITLMAGADRRRIADLHGPVLLALRQHDAALATEALRQHFVEIESMLRTSWEAGISVNPADVAGQARGAAASPSRPVHESKWKADAERVDKRRRALADPSLTPAKGLHGRTAATDGGDVGRDGAAQGRRLRRRAS